LPDDRNKAIDLASGEAGGLHAADVYDEHDTNTVLEINKRGKIQIYKFPESEIMKLMEKVKPLESDWVKSVSRKRIPAKELLAATKASVNRNR
jgi:hypothetical protein